MTLRQYPWLIAALAALTALSHPTPSLAQAAPPPAAAPGGFSLTPAEQARYNARLQKFNADVAALRADTTLTPAQKQAKFAAMQKTLDDDMLAILTPEQKTQVLKLRAQQKAKVTAFQKAHQSEIAQGQALANKLNKSMTPAQRVQMNKIAADINKQAAQVDADPSLSPQAKLAKKKALSETMQAKIMAIMTPAQRADYKKMQDMQKKLITEAGTPTKP